MRGQAMELVGPGRFEGLTPYQAWLCDGIDERADETSGNVESPTGWFALAGRYVVIVDDRGAYYALRYKRRDAARHAFEILDAGYGSWMTAEVDAV